MSIVFFADLIAFLIVIFYAVKGVQRGALISFMSIGGVIFAYIAALILSKPFGFLVALITRLPNLYGRVIAGAFIFITVSVLIRLAIKKILKRREENSQNDNTLTYSTRLWGAFLGIITAILVFTVIHWVYSLYRGTESGKALPEIGKGISGGISQELIRSAAYAAADANTADLVSRPDRTADMLRRLFARESVNKLMSDPDFRNALLDGDEDAIMNNTAYRRLFEDEETVDLLRQLGAVRTKTDEAAERMADPLANTGRKLGKVLEEPDVQKKVEELKEEGMLERRNWPRLVFDRRFIDIMERVMEDDD